MKKIFLLTALFSSAMLINEGKCSNPLKRDHTEPCNQSSDLVPLSVDLNKNKTTNAELFESSSNTFSGLNELETMEEKRSKRRKISSKKNNVLRIDENTILEIPNTLKLDTDQIKKTLNVSMSFAKAKNINTDIKTLFDTAIKAMNNFTFCENITPAQKFYIANTAATFIIEHYAENPNDFYSMMNDIIESIPNIRDFDTETFYNNYQYFMQAFHIITFDENVDMNTKLEKIDNILSVLFQKDDPNIDLIEFLQLTNTIKDKILEYNNNQDDPYDMAAVIVHTYYLYDITNNEINPIEIFSENFTNALTTINFSEDIEIDTRYEIATHAILMPLQAGFVNLDTFFNRVNNVIEKINEYNQNNPQHNLPLYEDNFYLSAIMFALASHNNDANFNPNTYIFEYAINFSLKISTLLTNSSIRPYDIQTYEQELTQFFIVHPYQFFPDRIHRRINGCLHAIFDRIYIAINIPENNKYNEYQKFELAFKRVLSKYRHQNLDPNPNKNYDELAKQSFIGAIMLYCTYQNMGDLDITQYYKEVLRALPFDQNQNIIWMVYKQLHSIIYSSEEWNLEEVNINDIDRTIELIKELLQETNQELITPEAANIIGNVIGVIFSLNFPEIGVVHNQNNNNNN